MASVLDSTVWPEARSESVRPEPSGFLSTAISANRSTAPFSRPIATAATPAASIP